MTVGAREEAMASPENQAQPRTEGAAQQGPGLPTITLPTGGGAIRGIGEKFAANPVTGTGSFTVPLAVSPGRSGFTPSLALTYNTGRGNSPFGLGWNVSTPNITRKTDQGLPRYADNEESDVFQFSETEDLVPVLAEDGTPMVDPNTWPGWTVCPYRPRTEGLFARIERWTNDASGETHWRSISRDNITTRYGVTDASRVTDGHRTFSWLICETWDSLGNAMVYQYAPEDAVGVDTTAGSECTRSRGAARYLTHVKYGNCVSRLVQPDLSAMEWLFEVVFDYDQGRLLTPAGSASDVVLASSETAQGWAARPDPFSCYRAGFEVRTHRRCHRVLMFHRFAELGDKPCLVRSTDLDYDDIETATATVDSELEHLGSTRFGSVLRSVTQTGYVRDPNLHIETNTGAGYISYRRKSLPRLEFDYTTGSIHEQPGEIDAESLENLPIGLANDSYQWVDLLRTGISGILTDQGDTWYFKENLGSAQFGPLIPLPTRPSNTSLSGGQAQLLDLAGDGRLSVVDLGGPDPGFATLAEDGSWSPYRSFQQLPMINWNDPNLRITDLNNDGKADLLLAGDDTFTWYDSLGEAGFGQAHVTAEPPGESEPVRLVFADGEQAIYVADMVGDSLPGLVRIRNGRVSFFPGIGYGQFGREVVMDNSPWFDRPEQFDQRRIRLADFHGTGTIDILYLGADGPRLYLNQSGNRLTDARPLSGLPPYVEPVKVQTVDLFGNGTGCLVWSSPLPSDSRQPMRYLDLLGGTKPNLLRKVANNLGAETELEYTDSTSLYLADRRAGRPWLTRLHFPVQVLTRVTSRDRISGNRFVTQYAYRDPFYDHIEREFRGFGMVKQWDAEHIASAATDLPPVCTKTWYHTGYFAGRDHISDYYAGLLDASDIGEYYRERGLSDEQARKLLLPDTLLPDGLTLDEQREACRALRGSMLRQEVYADDLREGATDAEKLRTRTPYSVIEQNFTVEVLQRRGPNRHAVFFTHARETINYHYERNATDPRTTHDLTLEVDRYGNVLRSASIGYPRRSEDSSLPSIERALQARTLITYTENDVTTNDLTDPSTWPNDHRTPMPAESRTYELTGVVAKAGRFEFIDVLKAIIDAEPIGYEQPPVTGHQNKRLIERVCTLYRADDLTDPLPLGTVGARGLIFRTYRLALTPALISQVFGDRVDDALLAEGGYVHNSEGDPGWWIPSGTLYYSPDPAASAAAELTFAEDHFFLPHRFRTPFHTPATSTESFVRYDQHDLLVQETRDALGNRVTAGERDQDPERPLASNGLDYRVLQPALVMDPNRNRSATAFDALDLVVGTALMGKPAPAQAEGDLLADSFRTDPSNDEIGRFFIDPDGPQARTLLDQATTRIVYDMHAYQRTRDSARPSPAAAAVIARQAHVSDPAATGLALQVSLSYSDGFGREIQRKVQAKPAPGSATPRWVGSGWTIFNNKGKPVQKFEPFFSPTPGFESDAKVGVSPILCYDPLERVIATLHPDHSWEKVVFDAWLQENWDGNDTVAIPNPAKDTNVGGIFARLPPADYLPIWSALQTTPQRRRAAAKAMVHAATPTITYNDSLGRPCLVVTHNRAAYSDAKAGSVSAEEFQHTRTELDIEGNQRSVTDALGRVVICYDYDMSGNRLRSSSMEAGTRWTLNDVTGKPLCNWDSRDHRIRITYDVLRRPTEIFLRTGSAAEQIIGRTVYGESWRDAEANNLRGHAIQVFDQAGVATTDRYDFKGNLLRAARKFASAYDSALDWSGAVPLEPETYTGTTQYDALNRSTQIVAPHSDQPGTVVNVVQHSYSPANLLDQVDAWLSLSAEPEGPLDPATATMHAVTSIDHDAKGQRTQISYGNGTRTKYDYDPITFRLIRLRTGVLQDQNYTYDPVGNVTELRDSAQQTVFFANKRVEPSAEYTYDATYRLIEATGREHLGQVGGTPIPHSYNDAGRVNLPHPGDGNALGRYLERYTYDQVGNFSAIQHIGTDPVAPGWTRTYSYTEPSQLDATTPSNRLTSTILGQNAEKYSYDAHGNMLTMPQLQEMRWDFRDQLHLTRRQAVNENDADGVVHAGERTWYVYDATGQRVRKVTETAPDQIKDERIYLGGFEIYHRRSGDRLTRESLHLMDDKQRIALIEIQVAGAEPGVPEQLVRYQLGNPVGSVSVELDEVGGMISYEEYTPYGSTSYQAALVQTTTKRYRYTGQEREEESGLNHHGARYYAPWLARWTSCDPLGITATLNAISASLNMYEYTGGRPTALHDPTGMWGEAGHFYTAKAVALLVGFRPELAERIAGFTQLPDEVHELDAVSAGFAEAVQSMNLVVQMESDEGRRGGIPLRATVEYANTRIQSRAVQTGLHALTGDYVRDERARRATALSAAEPGSLSHGLALHAFGDSFSHARPDGSGRMFEAPFGHASLGHDPDLIGKRPALYGAYVRQLFDILGTQAKLNSKEKVELVDTAEELIRMVTSQSDEQAQIKALNKFIQGFPASNGTKQWAPELHEKERLRDFRTQEKVPKVLQNFNEDTARKRANEWKRDSIPVAAPR
jgi:RHS repeat-associated protein